MCSPLVSLCHHLFDPLYPTNPFPPLFPLLTSILLSVIMGLTYSMMKQTSCSFSCSGTSPYLTLTFSLWTQVPKAILIRREAGSAPLTALTSRPSLSPPWQKPSSTAVCSVAAPWLRVEPAPSLAQDPPSSRKATLQKALWKVLLHQGVLWEVEG